MSEAFDGARQRFKLAGQDKDSPTNVRVTIVFTDAYQVALRWARKQKYTYERDGELGGMLLAALSAGVLPLASYDFDFDEEMDVDVEAE